MVGNRLSRTKPDELMEECTCETYGNTSQGKVITYKQFRPSREFRSRGCPSCRGARERKAADEMEKDLEDQRVFMRSCWRRECGMSAYLQERTFDNWERKYQREAFKAASDWAKDFNLDHPMGYRSLIFYSEQPGVGKGHLMAGIVNYVIDNWKGNPTLRSCPIRFESGPGLVRRVRATYNLRKEDDYHEREDEVYAKLAGVSLLLLDDVGKERASNFTRDTYWYIIDERVKAGLPVIISSRLQLEGADSLEELMGEDTVDRLFGMTRGMPIIMTGSSYRRRNAVP